MNEWYTSPTAGKQSLEYMFLEELSTDASIYLKRIASKTMHNLRLAINS